MSERVFSPQPVTQYNPITGEVRKEIEKSAVDDNPKVSKVSGESNMSAVVAPVIDNVPVATETDKETEPVVAVVEKHNPKVTSVKAVNRVHSIKSKLKDTGKIADKVDMVVKKSVKASSLVADKFDVVKDKVDVVADKALDALKNKLTGKGKKPVVGKDKDKPKNIASNVVKEKFKPNPKQEKDVSDSELETDVVDYSSDEADRKRKKLKIKAGDKIEVTPSKIHDMLGVPFRGYSLFDMDER
uniref:Peptidase C48, SUMO/sentrin/Ubl1 n=1 Tax=Tanacetum cinerariifolium TaxID=118510 RepID=A0A6L2LNC3_TANCI|nr:peptidase C48, SUMO/sentrin/Ubl1 [Tanacetum cinerariifolium]